MTIEFDIQCPYCGQTNECHTRGPEEIPKPGDVSLCWSCHYPSIYDTQRSIRRPTDKELDEIMKSSEYRRAIDYATHGYTPQETGRMLWQDNG